MQFELVPETPLKNSENLKDALLSDGIDKIHMSSPLVNISNTNQSKPKQPHRARYGGRKASLSGSSGIEPVPVSNKLKLQLSEYLFSDDILQSDNSLLSSDPALSPFAPKSKQPINKRDRELDLLASDPSLCLKQPEIYPLPQKERTSNCSSPSYSRLNHFRYTKSKKLIKMEPFDIDVESVAMDTSIKIQEEPTNKKRRRLRKKERFDSSDEESKRSSTTSLKPSNPNTPPVSKINPTIMLSSDDDIIGLSMKKAPSDLSLAIDLTLEDNTIDDDLDSPVVVTKKSRKKVYQPADDVDAIPLQDVSAQEPEEENSSEEMTDLEELPARETYMFFDTCNMHEIIDATGCSAELANLLISLRPFDSQEIMHEKFSQQKKQRYLFSIEEKYLETLECYEAVDRVVSQCQVRQTMLLKSLETFGIRLDKENSLTQTEVENGLSFEQPKLINPAFKLKDYQLVGVAWLSCLNKCGLGGILADEMGLGKTAQVIAFIAHTVELGLKGPHLIVVPSSVLDNWLAEFDRWCPALRVQSYHGSAQERMYFRMEYKEDGRNFDVLLTTYNIVAGHRDDRGFLKRIGFKSLILDEGHMIKNMTSARYSNIIGLNISKCFLLTGTPLQNNLKELLSLLTFVTPDLREEGTDLHAIKKLFKLSSTGSSSTERIERAKGMLAPFILRRSKNMVLQELPKKISTVEVCSMVPHQRQVYNQVMNKKKNLDLEAAADITGTDKVQRNKLFNNLLMDMRKAANHPLLMRTQFDDKTLRKMAKCIRKEPEFYDSNEEYIFEDMQIMSDHDLDALCKKYPKTMKSFCLDDQMYLQSAKVKKLEQILPERIQQGDRILLFSQFVMQLDILEEVLEMLKISYVRMDGQTHVRLRQEMIDKFNSDPSISVFLLSTKACGLGLNLTSANVVILHDLDFNPHNDAQAEDRAHRVGQTRQVTIIRLVTQETIDEQILSLAASKLELDHKMRSLAATNNMEEGEDELDDSTTKKSSKKEDTEVDDDILQQLLFNKG